MKKILVLGGFMLSLFFVLGENFVLAQYTEPGTTILPTSTFSFEDCEEMFRGISESELKEFMDNDLGRTSVGLGCAITTGRVKLWMIPFFIKYLIEFVIALAGIVCMFFIVFGGYYYMFGGITQDQEKGKNTIMYAIVGLIVCLLAWIIVNTVMYAVTR